MAHGVEEANIMKKLLDGEWNLGIVCCRINPNDKWERIYEKPKGENNMIVGPATVPFGFRPADHLEAINA